MLQELRTVDRQSAIDTLARVKNGYQDKSGASYAAAILTNSRCIVAQKSANRALTGYVQIAPIRSGTRAGTLNGVRQTKPLIQAIHRLAVVAYGTEDSRIRMLENGWHTSHRCHNSRCFAPDHIVVERKAANEARKAYAKEFWFLLLVIDGERKTAKSIYQCFCKPSCIARELHGVINQI